MSRIPETAECDSTPVRRTLMANWIKQNMVEPELEDGWIYVHTHDEETLLQHCWRDLPFDLPYSEFRAKMLEMKRHYERSRLTRTTLWTLETVWSLTGYATTMFSVAGYRSVLVSLLLWMAR